jgi:hypothetical protein
MVAILEASIGTVEIGTSTNSDRYFQDAFLIYLRLEKILSFSNNPNLPCG